MVRPAVGRAATRGRWLLLAVAATLAGLASACAPDRPGTGPGQPPVVLISIDTLRSDHLPAYGYRAVQTPAIDALRQDGVLFERAYSAVPLTAPSHASIFSGVPPSEHGLRDNVGYPYPAERLSHLPTVLHGLGYQTGGAISAFVLRGDVGFAKGFDLYDDKIATRMARGLSGIQRSGTETLAAARTWLQGAAGGPFFFFLHIYEPHAPYKPPPPYDTRYPLLYDGEIAAADAVVGELVAELKRLGVYDRAAIVLLSDHGEGLGEHGEDGHGVFLYRHDLQVPLILKLPAAERAGATVASVVRLTDVHPTLLEIAGAQLSAAQRESSLLSTLTGTGSPGAADRLVYAETYTPRLHFGWSELHSLIEGTRHYIQAPEPELYDLASDPGELRNLIAEDRRGFARLRTALQPLLVPLAPPRIEDEETRKQLAALGYIGFAAAPAGAVLPDPKKMIHTLNYLHEGLELFGQDRAEAAAKALRLAVDANPFMVDAWDYLGRSYQKLRQPERALAAFKEATKLSGGLPETALAIASTLVEMGKPEEARLVIEGQIARSPQDLRLRFLQARLLMLDQDLDGAERVAQETLQRAPANPDAHYQLGVIAMTRRNLPVAEQHFRRALELDPQHPAALADLAVLLASTGRADEALAIMRALVALRPNDEVARANLERIAALAAGGPRPGSP